MQKGEQDGIDWHALATQRSTAASVPERLPTSSARAAHSSTLALRIHPMSRPHSRSEAGVRALEAALRRIKQAVIASNVMELITCGAVPPYRDVLGGKLVALMMLSRTVVKDYERKYAGQVSLIASGLAGRPVVRPARLALAHDVEPLRRRQQPVQPTEVLHRGRAISVTSASA